MNSDPRDAPWGRNPRAPWVRAGHHEVATSGVPKKKKVDFQWCFVMFLMMFDDFQWGFSMTSIVFAALRMVFLMPSAPATQERAGRQLCAFPASFWARISLKTQQAEHGDMPGLWQNMMPWKLYGDPKCWPQPLLMLFWYGYKLDGCGGTFSEDPQKKIFKPKISHWILVAAGFGRHLAVAPNNQGPAQVAATPGQWGWLSMWITIFFQVFVETRWYSELGSELM